MTNLLLCGCEPHGHKCLISEGGCGRCFEHCVCTPSGVASTGAGRAEDTGSPGTPPFRPLAQSLAGLHCRVPGVVACPYSAALLPGFTLPVCGNGAVESRRLHGVDSAERYEHCRKCRTGEQGRCIRFPLPCSGFEIGRKIIFR